MITRIQVAYHPAGNACKQNAARHDRSCQHHRARGDQRARPDPGPAKNDRAHPYQSTLPHVSAVHDRAMAEADPGLEDGRLTGVDMNAAQILNVAFFSDRDLIFVGAQHAAVPDARPGADRYGAHDDGAWGYPRRLSDCGSQFAKRTDHERPLTGHNHHGVIIADCRGRQMSACPRSSSHLTR